MPTTRPYNTFGIATFDSNSYGIDTMTSLGVAMTTPATLTNPQVTLTVDSPQTVEAKTTYLFGIFINNPLPKGGIIRILVPPEVGVTYLTTVKPEARLNSGVTLNIVDGN